MLLKAHICVKLCDGLRSKLGHGLTSLALRIEIRTGNSSRMTGKS